MIKCGDDLRRRGAALAFFAVLLVCHAGTSARASVKWLLPGELGPGEELVPDPFPHVDGPPIIHPPIIAPADEAKLEKVRIAVRGDDASQLAGLSPHEASFETVKSTANPDLLWDPSTHNVSSGPDVVAYAIQPAKLAAVIDRTAVVNALARLAEKRPQNVKLAASTAENKGKTQILVGDVSNRALVVVDIAGDGVAQLFYPVGADPHVVRTSPYALPAVTMTGGTDVFVAITAAKPIAALEQRLRDSPVLEATELLKLISQNLTQDTRLGLLKVTSAQ